MRVSDVLHAIPCGCPVIADCALKLNQRQGEKERVAVVVRFMWWRILYVGEALAQALERQAEDLINILLSVPRAFSQASDSSLVIAAVWRHVFELAASR